MEEEREEEVGGEEEEKHGGGGWSVVAVGDFLKLSKNTLRIFKILKIPQQTTTLIIFSYILLN